MSLVVVTHGIRICHDSNHAPSVACTFFPPLVGSLFQWSSSNIFRLLATSSLAVCIFLKSLWKVRWKGIIFCCITHARQQRNLHPVCYPLLCVLYSNLPSIQGDLLSRWRCGRHLYSPQSMLYSRFPRFRVLTYALFVVGVQESHLRVLQAV